ncbi:Benzoate 4-monooxygenase cytochrome P450 [Apiospora marii]|uniref:Benzoate 4-monooxygenase cytochrome P450 n=1 Tax=Apiospora marii TaxID=335849 RepID=UPI0031316D5E
MAQNHQIHSAAISGSQFIGDRISHMHGVQLIPLAAGLVLTVALLRAFRTWSALRHVPGPFLASFTNLPRSWWVMTGRAHQYHRAAHAKYGDVVRIGPRMVSVSNPDAIPIIYPFRPGFPKSDFYATLRPYTRERGSMLAVFNTQDEQIHKRLKSPIAPLFALSNATLFEGLVEEVLACLSTQLDRRFVDSGDTFDLGDWMQYFAFDVMGTMSFSKRYGFLDQGRDVGGMLNAIFQFFKTAAPVCVTPQHAWCTSELLSCTLTAVCFKVSQITWLDKLLYKNRLIHTIRQTPGMTILGFVGKAIRERLACSEDSQTEIMKKTADRDFLSRFLEIQKANSDLPPWASTAWTFSNVIAGSDSKLKQELTDANLSRPFPKWGEVRDLPYLDGCVNEAARIHPPFALPLERVVPEGGVEVLGTYLPPGTLVGGNPYVVNRHKATFGDNVEDWDPERWLVGDEHRRKKMEQGLLTFGAGRRVCLGKHIGIFEVKKLVPYLVVNYDIRIHDPKGLAMENRFFFRQKGLHCTLKKRDLQ